jgi:hypothetical protein
LALILTLIPISALRGALNSVFGVFESKFSSLDTGLAQPVAVAITLSPGETLAFLIPSPPHSDHHSGHRYPVYAASVAYC